VLTGFFILAPSFIETISNNIKKLDLAAHPDQDRIIIETFGYDKKSAELLNKLLSKTFKEEQIYHRPLSGKEKGAKYV
jgi:glucose-6-phosphate 1-dehydrogenase